MDCPQCGAEVPNDDVFCGKCGYARRDQAPDRVDQSRIRVHEEPEQQADPPDARPPSQARVRKHTVMGMPSATPPTGSPTPPQATEPPAPPTEISSARSRAKKRTPQKTMLGIPRPNFPTPPPEPGGEATPAEPAEPSDAQSADSASPSHRARARVRYDSANEPFPVVQRRKKALRGLALLVLLAGGWLVYRYFSLNG
jgi:hypothetical protein